MKGFFDFIRERKVGGFAVGFILGGAVTKVISALVADIINPFLGLILSKTKSLESMYVQIGGSRLKWGHFLSEMINFLILAFVVYLIVRVLNIEGSSDKKNKAA